MYHYRNSRPFTPHQFRRRYVNTYPRGRKIVSSHVIHEYIRKAKTQVSSVLPQQKYQVVSFDAIDLSMRLKINIKKMGYKTLTPIQSLGIPLIQTGKDVIGIANTGTGKTAAFLIPLIEKIQKDKTYKALIITPTRELALQIHNELRKFSSGIPLYSAFCIGQSSIHMQICELYRNPQIVIGTPGRLKDLIERKALKLSSFTTFVLGEADQMLDMGFIRDIRYIISFLPFNRQSLFFSATVSPQINLLIKSFVKNPITISVKTQETVSHIKQEIIQVTDGAQKIQKLLSLLSQEEFKKVIVFGRTKMGVEKLSRTLFKQGLRVTSLHGDKPQFQRQQAIRMFRDNVVRILIATDVASRGLDIPDVSHVINYEIPETYEDYIHRIGRTGRANKSGTALTFTL